MGLRFTDEPTTAVYEFEKMSWDEMDEVFYTEDEIGDFRHTAFMIECGLEEEDWDVPDVEPLPWPKEIDERKIKKFETNLTLLKQKRKQQMADFAANGYPPPKDSPDNPVIITEPPKSETTAEPDPVKVEPEKIKADDSKSSIESQPTSSRTATTEESTFYSPTKPTIPLAKAPTSPKANKSPTIETKISPTRKIKSPRRSPMTSPMKSPIKRSYSMGIRSKDKTALDNILKKIESPTVSPKKKAQGPTTATSPKSKEASNTMGATYTAPLISGGGEKIKTMPYRSHAYSSTLKKANKKNRSKVLASLDASLDGDELPDKIPPRITALKPTKSADLEHMRVTADEDEDEDKKERKLRRSLMRTHSGSLSKVKREPRKGKKPRDEDSPTKPSRRMKKGSLDDSSSKIDDGEGSKKKKRNSLSKQPSQRGLGSDKEGSVKPKKRSSLKRSESLRLKRTESEASVGSKKPKKRSSLKRSESLRLKRTESEASVDSKKPKKRSSLKRQASLKRSESFKSGDSTKKKRPSLKHSDSNASGASTSSSKKRPSSLKRQNSMKNSESSIGSPEPADRKPRRGMKREESLRLKYMEGSLSEISADLSKDGDGDKPSKPRSTRSSPKKKKSKDKKSGRGLGREDSESSMSEDDLNDSSLLSPIREPTTTRKRGKSVDRSRSFHSAAMSSNSSGVSFLGSIDCNSIGSDQSIETVDDDEFFDVPARSVETDDESDNEMQQEFYRYMKAQPKSRVSGVKVFTVYHEKKSSMHGKIVANRDYVCAALVLSGGESS